MFKLLPASRFREGRWPNDMGVSWDIAIDPPDATVANFGWRFALARIDADVPFSAYSNVERHLTLLEGDGFDLDVSNFARLAIHERCVPWHFPGDAASRACLRGGPSKVLNLFVRRGQWRADISVVGAFEDISIGPCDLALLFVIEGQCRSGDARLMCGDAAVAGPEFTIAAASPRCLLYLAHLHRC